MYDNGYNLKYIIASDGNGHPFGTPNFKIMFKAYFQNTAHGSAMLVTTKIIIDENKQTNK